LGPGDGCVVPNGWWHTIEIMELEAGKVLICRFNSGEESGAEINGGELGSSIPWAKHSRAHIRGDIAVC